MQETNGNDPRQHPTGPLPQAGPAPSGPPRRAPGATAPFVIPRDGYADPDGPLVRPAPPRPWGRRLLVTGVALLVVAAAVATASLTVFRRGGPADLASGPGGSSGPANPSGSGPAGSTPGSSASPTASVGPSATAAAKPKPALGANLPPRGSLPAPAGFPAPANTGWQHTGVTLTARTALVYADKAGAVYDSLDLRGGIEVRADNVTIRRSRVSGSGSGPGAGIWIDQGVAGTVITDVEITSKDGAELVDRAITGDKTNKLTISRAYVHKVIRGIEFGFDTTITDSYIDDEVNPTDAHMSAIGGDTSTNWKLVVRHNWVALAPNPNNSAALLYYPEDTGTAKQNVSVLIEQNIISGGSYCMWLASDPRMQGSVTVRDNMFSTKYYDTCGHYNTHFTDNLGKGEGNIAVIWDNNVWYSPGTAKNGKPVTWVIQY